MIGLAGGIAVGLQGPLASIMTQRMGPLESSFIVHTGGALISLIPLLLIGGGKIAQWRSVPWYALCAGFFGLVVLSAVSYTTRKAESNLDLSGRDCSSRMPRFLNSTTHLLAYQRWR